MNSKIIFFCLLGLDVLVLLLETTHLSISYNEALILYGDKSFLQYLTKFFINIFGNNDLGLRFLMILLHIGSVVLMYEISKNYLKSNRNRLWLMAVFILLPGVVSSALVVNHAGLIIFGLLLYIYLGIKFKEKYLFVLLFVLSLLDSGFSYLFLTLGIYYLFQKNRWMTVYNTALYLLSISLYNVKIDGIPSGHLLDTLGVYSAIFTPIIFIYIFYVLYRRYLTNNIDKIWYISSIALLISLVLSFRQRIEVEVFAPYLMLALPLAAQTFVSSYRVRVKEFRKKYKFIFGLSLVLLILNTVIVFFNYELYRFLDNPKKHFAYDMNVARELAKDLRSKNIKCVKTDYKMQLRLKFYGIKECGKYRLKELNLNDVKKPTVTISYSSKVVYKGYVTKINMK